MGRKRRVSTSDTESRKGAARDACTVAEDNLPSRIPVTSAELDAIESFFGSLLDEIL